MRGGLVGSNPPRPRAAVWLERVVFGAFAALAVSRLWLRPGGPWIVVEVVVLVLLAFYGHRYASSGLLSRVSGILVFLAGWFWSPVAALITLWIMAWLKRFHRRATVENQAPGLPVDVQQDPDFGGPQSEAAAHELAQQALTLRVASECKVKRFHAPFSSVYGDGVVPLLVDVDGTERGLYVEVGPWEWEKKEQYFRWLGLLRTSDLEDLAVEVRSDTDVPADVTALTVRTPRAVFEVVGLLQMKWGSVAALDENATNVKRLAREYLEVDLSDDEQGLETLDKLVVDVLRPAGNVLPSTLMLLSCFFGRVLLNRHGGRWLVNGEDPEQIVVELRSPVGRIEANVFGKVLKLYHNGIEDSTLWMARSMADRLAGN